MAVNLTGLTRLTWEHPLAASIRLALAAGRFRTAVAVDKHGAVVEDNFELRSFLNDYVGTDPEEYDRLRAEFAVDVDRDVFQKYRFTDSSNVSAPGVLIDPFSLWEPQTAFVDELRAHTEIGPKRAVALVGVLFTELGWQVKHIARMLGVSRPTVTKWLNAEIANPIIDAEIAIVNTLLKKTGCKLIDIRPYELRVRRTGLSWRKVFFLPPPGILEIMEALSRAARLSYRGRRSVEDDACAELLDLMLDLCMRRGVTAASLAECLHVTHRTILTRLERSDMVRISTPPRKLDPDDTEILWWDLNDLVSASGTPPIKDGREPTSPQRFLLKHTVAQPQADGGDERALLLRVRTHEASSKNALPLPNVDVLHSVRLEDLTPSQHEALYNLDLVLAGDVESQLRDQMRGQFHPLLLECKSVQGRRHAAEDAEAIADGISIDPMLDPDLMALLFGVARFGDPHTAAPMDWEGTTVFGEALLMRAAAVFDRDAPRIVVADIPGFGTTTYHWVPESVFDKVIRLGQRDRYEAEVRATLVRPPGRHNAQYEAYLAESLRGFLPPALLAKVEQWQELVQADPGSQNINGRTLLWVCLHQPWAALAVLPLADDG